MRDTTVDIRELSNTTAPTKLAYTIKQACEVSGIGKTAFYELLNRGAIRAVKRGRQTLVLAHDLNQGLSTLPEYPRKQTQARACSHKRNAKLAYGGITRADGPTEGDCHE